MSTQTEAGPDDSVVRGNRILKIIEELEKEERTTTE